MKLRHIYGCIALLATPLASADVIGFEATRSGVNDCTSGAVAGCVIAPQDAPLPTTMGPDPDDGILLVWEESQTYVLTEDLRIDTVADESSSSLQFFGDEWWLSAGTVISSYYIQWDSGADTDRWVDTTIRFDEQIIGIMFEDDTLFASDFLGAAGVEYQNFPVRGLEALDVAWITDDGYGLEISWHATTPGDWARVITIATPVPVPAALPLFACALGALGFASRRKANA